MQAFEPLQRGFALVPRHDRLWPEDANLGEEGMAWRGNGTGLADREQIGKRMGGTDLETTG